MEIRPGMALLTICLYTHFNEMYIKSNRCFCELYFLYRSIRSQMKFDVKKVTTSVFQSMVFIIQPLVQKSEVTLHQGNRKLWSSIQAAVCLMYFVMLFEMIQKCHLCQKKRKQKSVLSYSCVFFSPKEALYHLESL